jgi:methylthioribose-1-phosphate isomerase
MTVLAASRPTAVNLFWALNRMRAKLDTLNTASVPEIAHALLAEAHAIAEQDVRLNRAMGQHGAALLRDNMRVLTHCNAGALATAGHGTALGVIRSAVAAGKRIQVYANETRPFLQGARLTAWELLQDRCGPRRRGPHRRQRRRGQQDRHLQRGGAGAAAWPAVLCGGATVHD